MIRYDEKYNAYLLEEMIPLASLDLVSDDTLIVAYVKVELVLWDLITGNFRKKELTSEKGFTVTQLCQVVYNHYQNLLSKHIIDMGKLRGFSVQDNDEIYVDIVMDEEFFK